MADFDLILMAEELGRSLQNLDPILKAEVNRAVRDTAFGAHAKIISELQKRNTPAVKRKAYLEALTIGKIPGGYVISLDGDWATRLEDGFSSYSIKDLLLASGKMVEKGSGAGKPFVKTGKDGKKYAHVPFSKKPFSAEPGLSDMNAMIQRLSVKNAKGRRQRITSTFKDLEGARAMGKVAVVGQEDLDRQGITDPNLVGLTKYQETSDSGANVSFYATFRTVSEDSTGWMYPASSGYGLFKQAERYVEDELNRIINNFGK